MKIKHYNDLTKEEFHDIVALRIAIFVVEQNCPYQELDGKDKVSFHLMEQTDSGEIIATLRIIPASISYEEVSIGRVVVSTIYRNQSFGHKIMHEALAFIRSTFGNVPVRISAQSHLEEFYKIHGFHSTGKTYLEDNIPHTEMLKNPI